MCTLASTLAPGHWPPVADPGRLCSCPCTRTASRDAPGPGRRVRAARRRWSRTSAAGESRSLVLRGEAGIGKTALLDHLIESAPRPDRRARRRRRVGDGAGLREPASALRPDARPAGAAARSAARRAPDRVRDDRRGCAGPLPGRPRGAQPRVRGRPRSARCCASSTTPSGSTGARRSRSPSSPAVLLAEPVGFVFAAREPGEELRHLPAARGARTGQRRRPRAAELGGAASRWTGRSATGSSRRPAGTRWRCSSCPRGLTPTQLAGGFGMPEARDLPQRIEASYVRRLEAAPRRTRGGCCSSRRPSRSAIRCSCSAPASASGSRSPRSTRPTGCWRSRTA